MSLAVEIELPDGTILEAPDGADPSAVAKGYLAKQKGARPSFAAQLGSAAVRPLAKGAAALPLIVMDAGVASRNLIGMAMNPAPRPTVNDLVRGTKPQSEFQPYELPSAMFNRALDAYTLPPEGAGKAFEFVSSALVGARLPAPQAAQQAPANFMRPRDALKNQVLQASQKEGYVVPPSANNPTLGNRMLEGIAGKVKLNQEAAIRNQPVTDRLAARGVGQSDDAPLTQGALATIRKEAGEAHKAIQNAPGRFEADDKFRRQLAALKGTYEDVAKDFPGLAKPEITDALDALRVESFSPRSALSAIRIVRENSDEAFAAGNKALAKALKQAASAMEDLVERNLTRLHAHGQLETLIKQGALDGDDSTRILLEAALKNPSSKMLKDFRNARTLIAKTYTAGKALVDDAGGSNARTYASELQRGKPLTGDQRKIASFASSFGKYTPKPTGENFTPLGPLDMYGAAGVSAAADSALPFAYPLTRVGLREFLLSPAGQARAIRAPYRARETMGLLGALPVAENELVGFFGQ